MSIVSLLLTIFTILFLLLFIILGYLQIYKRNINKVLDAKQDACKRMIPPYKVVAAMTVLLIVAVATFSAIYISSDPVTSPQELERSAQQLAAETGMDMEFAISDDLAAVLLFNEDKSDHSFKLYENKGRLTANYVFSHGGSSTSIEESVRVFRYSGELALFSLNELQIARIVCHDGETHLVDPDRPFVLIIPSGGADFYNKAGDLIDLDQGGWYEITVKE